MRRLEGRVAVITGAASGLGKATALRFADEGARVVVVDVNATAGEPVAEACGGLFVAADVTDSTDVARVFRTAFDTYGSVDIAFNNAGISPPEDDSILTTGLDVWRRVQEVNLTSVYLCCQSVIPYMQRQGKGSIINTASFVASMGSATSQISYTASKGGVLAMTRELGVQFAREGIRVNALSPGPVNTPLLAEALCQRPRARRTQTGAHPDGSVRRCLGNSCGSGVPGLRRRILHYRYELLSRRRYYRRLRHSAVARQAARNASNRRVSSSTSGCHCTPTTKRLLGSSQTSMVPSTAQPVMVSRPASATD